MHKVKNTIAFLLCTSLVNSIIIPWNDQKSGAVIVTLEDEANARGLNEKQIPRHISKLWPSVENDKDLILLGQVLEDFEKGRGKSHKYKKITKFMYPLLMGVLVAKIVLVPLILKTLTAVSASALVMSKIALITTGFLAMKWIFAGTVHDGKDHFEFIYLPTPSSGKPYRSAAGSFSLWDDQSWSDSNTQYTAAAAAAPAVSRPHLQKYIPVNFKNGNSLPYNSYHPSGRLSKTGLSDDVNDLYYYSQHNYNNNNNNNGKPFI